MEGRFRLLLVAGLLASLLPAVSWPQPGEPCESTLLATQVALFCGDGVPSPECCYSVLASVDIGGGVPCLCRLGDEPQLVMAGLNSMRLRTLYTSCGGLLPGDAHIAAACEDEAPPPPSSTEKPSPPPQQHDGAAHSKAIIAYEATSPLAPAAALNLAAACLEGPAPPAAADVSSPPPSPAPGRKSPARSLLAPAVCEASSSVLSQDLVMFCGRTEILPLENCCRQVLRIVDTGCLCDVGEEPRIMSSTLDASHIWFLYGACGGKSNIPTDRTSCSVHQSPPPPPPYLPPPPVARPPPLPPSPSSTLPTSESVMEAVHSIQQYLSLTTLCLGLFTVVLVSVAVATVIALWRKQKKSAVAPAPPMEQKVVPLAHEVKSISPIKELEVPPWFSYPEPAIRSEAAYPQGQFLPPPSPEPSAPPEELMMA